MVDTAARLTDEILPAVAVRQWVLSMPFEIRYRLAWDGDLVSAVLAVFLRVVYGWYRRQSKKQGHGDGRCGSVTFVQRFGSPVPAHDVVVLTQHVREQAQVGHSVVDSDDGPWLGAVRHGVESLRSVEASGPYVEVL